jgi:hypothetical protein
MNLFDILNAEEVWIVPDDTKKVTGDERAVFLWSRERASQSSVPGLLKFCESGVYVKISISEISNVLSPAQKKALVSQDYKALEARELRSLGEIIAAAKLIPVDSALLLHP